MTLRFFLAWTARLTRAIAVLLRSSSCGGLRASEAEQLLHAVAVAARELGFGAQVPLPLRRLLLEDVVLEGLAAHDLAAAGHLEALGRALVGLHLRHRSSS